MKNPKFKVGDKVKVLRASTYKESLLWRDGWVDNMNKMIGKEYVVEYVHTNRDVFPMYRLGKYNLPEFVLQNACPIGKQLMLFDIWKE